MSGSKLAGVAIQAALRAGEILRRGFQTPYQISVKSGIHNYYTQYDKAAEEAIISLIKSYYPDHNFLAEESGGSPESNSVLWIIDPLDGTLNFVHHIPNFAVSIAAYADNAVQVGVIYLPITHDLFVAEKGKGAYLNGVKLSVSKTKSLENAVAVTGLPSSFTNNIDHLQPLIKLVESGTPIRDLGSAAIHLAYIASGQVDLFWIPRLFPWDVAAGKLLVEEAGGRVTHYDDVPHTIFPETHLLATNGLLHPLMLKNLQTITW